jgi:hypothetical protein
MTFRFRASGVEHPLLMVDFGVIGGIYRGYAADLTPLVIWRGLAQWDSTL